MEKIGEKRLNDPSALTEVAAKLIEQLPDDPRLWNEKPTAWEEEFLFDMEIRIDKKQPITAKQLEIVQKLVTKAIG